MNRLKFALLCAAALLVFNACSSTAPEKASNVSPSASPVTNASPLTTTPQTPKASEMVSVVAADVKVAAGAKGEAVIRLHIADGYHVNANPASEKFYIPTQLEVASSEGIGTGTPLYPASVNKKFAFSEQPLAVYEREAVIKLPLHADRTATKGARALHAKIRVQPCNDEVCFPPRTIETSINVIVE